MTHRKLSIKDNNHLKIYQKLMANNIPLPYSLAYDFKLNIGPDTYMMRVQTENKIDYYLLQVAKLTPEMEWKFILNKGLKYALLEVLLADV